MNKLRTRGLEEVYTSIDKQILLAQQYSNFSGLYFIIKACRLKPTKYFNKRSTNIILYREWFDEFGSTIHINKRKQVKITTNDLRLDVNNIPCTDIYFGLDIKNVVKISKLAYIQSGYNDVEKKLYCVSLLGIDNYFRTYLYDEGWEQISTLYIGMDNLKIIANSLDISKQKAILEPSIPMEGAKQFITPLPFMLYKNKLDNILSQIL